MLTLLSSYWLPSLEAIALLALVLILLAAIDSYLSYVRPSLGGVLVRSSHEQAAFRRREVAELLDDLWSTKLNERLAALALIGEFSDFGTGGTSYANVLTAFIRHRLSSSPSKAIDTEPVFEDVKIALETLSSRKLRAALRSRGQVVDLGGVDFSHAPLAGVDFSGYRLVGSKFDGCYLAGANFTDADLSSSTLVSANLSSVKFVRSNLSNADLAGADVSDAALNGANLKDTNVGGAILIGVTGLDQLQLDDAFGDDETAIPQQFKLATAGLRRPVALVSGVTEGD